MATSILFVSADPRDEPRLRLSEEHREIGEKLRLARLRDEFNLESCPSARPEDLSQALLDTNPTIVHFSGHGSSQGSICLEDADGKAQEVSASALGALFQSFGSQTRCVLLNACYSRVQAEAIAQHVAYVIGMSDEISDAGAIAFAVGFYQAIGAGRSFEDAFDLGLAQLQLRGVSEDSIPRLLRRQDLTSFHQRRVIPTAGGILTLLRRDRTITSLPDAQRIGLAVFTDAHSFELVALVTSSGGPDDSANITSAAMGMLKTYVQDILRRDKEPLKVSEVFRNCFVCLDLGVKAKVAATDLPDEIGAKAAIMFRLGGSIYAANIGDSGILGVWNTAEGRFIRLLNLKTRFAVDHPSPAVLATPLGHLVLGELDDALKDMGVTAEFSIQPECVPLAHGEDCVVLTSYGLPRSAPARQQLVEEVGSCATAEGVGRLLIENDLPEESAVAFYSRKREIADEPTD
jgi:hypothetical protein